MVVTAAGRDRSFWASKLFRRATPRDEAVCLCLWLQTDFIAECSGDTFHDVKPLKASRVVQTVTIATLTRRRGGENCGLRIIVESHHQMRLIALQLQPPWHHGLSDNCLSLKDETGWEASRDLRRNQGGLFNRSVSLAIA